MARDILSDYGRDSRQPQSPRATSGGRMPVQDVRAYSPPQGPKNINDSGPGLHGDNYGCCGTQGKHGVTAGTSGSPGLHGTNSGIRNRP